ncbi:hypothetical protein [Niabella beijingensis]|uniref:hypothetical protein n=1 Tax=Niabella beijingensis TaxID=2872700 RepID=UPI001CBD33B6|nr:hypothetical protein [Niabella beijingensis]MBZ4188333.1 hypothetical protein [Niabella beijingensis]
MLALIIRNIPQLIILSALFYYLIRKKSALSYVLFLSYLVSYAIGLLQFQQTISLSGRLAERHWNLMVLANISHITYLVFAIAFLKLMIDLLKPVSEKDPFLDDLRPGNTE